MATLLLIFLIVCASSVMILVHCMLCSIVFANCLLCDFHVLLNVVMVMNGLIV